MTPILVRLCRYLFLLAGFASCGTAFSTPVELTNADGSLVVLERPASRVIALAPHLAEVMYAAGAGDLLLATVEYSDYPEAAATLPRIGDAFRFDLERIMALKPDLVLAWQSGNPAPAQAGLEELGLTLWRTEITQPSEIADLVEAMGQATGRQQVAGAAAEHMRARLAALEADHQGKTAVSYFYQVAERPLYTVNGAHLISQGLSICGAVNVFQNLSALAPQVAREAVILADPETLVAPRIEGYADPLAQWREWPRMQAVDQQALIYLPANEISRATPRMLDAIEIACRLFDGFRSPQP
jgi:iron complex transport system substrate-binding protein